MISDLEAVLLMLSLVGVIITFLESDSMFADSTRLGIGRLFMVNLPLIILINLYLIGEL